MASIHAGGGASTRKSVDADIPLVPFIDLLLCCIMFLLVTAVWNQLASQHVQQQLPGDGSPDALPAVETLQLMLSITHEGYVLSSTAGDRLVLPRSNGGYDREGLRDQLIRFRGNNPRERNLTVVPDDGVAFEHLVTAMDVASGVGFTGLGLGAS